MLFLVCSTQQWDFPVSLVTFSWRRSSLNPVGGYTSGCIPSSCRTAWGRKKKIHRLWRPLRKRSQESKLEKADAFWELELNVSFQQANKGSVTDQLLWLAQGFTSLSSEVKKDVFDIREYFLAYGLVQSSYFRSVLPLLVPVPSCLTSDLFTQILLVVTFSRVKRSWLKRMIFRKS